MCALLLQARRCDSAENATPDPASIGKLGVDLVIFGEVALAISGMIRSWASRTEVLGSSHEEALYNMIDSISHSGRVMGRQTLHVQLGASSSAPKERAFAVALRQILSLV